MTSPRKRVQFLGSINSEKQCLELPQDKLTKLTALARAYSSKSKVTKKELEIIARHMSFAGKAVYGARTFNRIFVDAMSGLVRPRNHTCVTKLLRKELEWWQVFASSMNSLCYSLMGVPWPTKVVSTDASFSGFVAVSATGSLCVSWDAG